MAFVRRGGYFIYILHGMLSSFASYCIMEIIATKVRLCTIGGLSETLSEIPLLCYCSSASASCSPPHSSSFMAKFTIVYITK